MTTKSFRPAATHVGRRRATARRSRQAIALAGVTLAVFAASASACMVTATATCASVTFHWAPFSSYGNGNGGLNTPEWVIVFKPTVGPVTTLHDIASFPGSSFSLAVPIPSGNGVVTASSSWSSAETRDGGSDSGSTSLTIADCAVPVTPPAAVTPARPATVPAPVTPATPATPTAVTAAAAPKPVAPPTPVVAATLALSTSGSSAATPGGAIRDAAVLTGGSSPTGTITYSLYSASDSTCSGVLSAVTVVVSGDGTYVSPAVTPASAGSYQWVASYSGDENNQSLSGSCNDPTEQSTVAYPACVSSHSALGGVPETVRNSLSVWVPAPGVKSVTFYLDGRKLVTLAKPSHQRFSIAIDARKLSFGVHRLKAKVTMLSSSCAREAAATFIHVKPDSLPPTFAG